MVDIKLNFVASCIQQMYCFIPITSKQQEFPGKNTHMVILRKHKLRQQKNHYYLMTCKLALANLHNAWIGRNKSVPPYISRF